MTIEHDDGTDPRISKGFTQIPNCVLCSPELTPLAKVVYGILLSYSWGKDKVWPGLNAIAGQLGMSAASDKSIKRVVDELVAGELVEVVRRGQGKTNKYILLTPTDSRFGSTAGQADSVAEPNQESDGEPTLDSAPQPDKEEAGEEEARKKKQQHPADAGVEAVRAAMSPGKLKRKPAQPSPAKLRASPGSEIDKTPGPAIPFWKLRKAFSPASLAGLGDAKSIWLTLSHKRQKRVLSAAFEFSTLFIAAHESKKSKFPSIGNWMRNENWRMGKDEWTRRGREDARKNDRRITGAGDTSQYDV